MCSFRFPRKAGVMAEARSVASTKGRASCETDAVPWMPRCTKLGSCEDSSVIEQQSKNIKVSNRGVCIILAGSGSAETYPVVTC